MKEASKFKEVSCLDKTLVSTPMGDVAAAAAQQTKTFVSSFIMLPTK
jgi:hypothetical protein